MKIRKFLLLAIVFLFLLVSLVMALPTDYNYTQYDDTLADNIAAKWSVGAGAYGIWLYNPSNFYNPTDGVNDYIERITNHTDIIGIRFNMNKTVAYNALRISVGESGLEGDNPYLDEAIAVEWGNAGHPTIWVQNITGLTHLKGCTNIDNNPSNKQFDFYFDIVANNITLVEDQTTFCSIHLNASNNVNLSQLNYNWSYSFYSNNGVASIRNISDIRSSAITPSLTLNISNQRPTNDEQFDRTTINLNATVNSTTNFDCSFVVDGDLNSTDAYISGNDVFVSSNITFTAGSHNWFINCTNQNESVSSSTYSLWIDPVDPTITDDFTNGTIYYNENLTGQFNLSDNLLLHSYNISIDSNDIINGILDTTFYPLNLSLDLINISPGNHTLSVRVADGHTAKELKRDYKWSNGLFDDYLKYNFYGEGYIKTRSKTKSILDKWTTTRKKDRYIQTYEPANPSSTITFIEESDMPIYIKHKPGHYNDYWLIIGDHWKDYVLENEPDAQVSIKRIDQYKVEVTINRIKNPEKLIFNSVGDLNIITKNYTFIKTNMTLTHTLLLFETDEQTITLEINRSGFSTDADLYWNESLISSTKTSFENYDRYVATFTTPNLANISENVTFYWAYNLSGSDGNITNNQTIYRISIDNCSTYTTRAINFTLIDESTNLPIVGEIHATLHTYRSSSSNYRENSFNFEGANNYSICIYPSWANYTLDSYAFEYLADGYATEEYMVSNLDISNKTQNINLYLVNESLSDNVIITLRDTDDNLLENYTIRVRRYYPESGEEITTEITETDHNGNAVVHLILNDVYYTFSLERDGTVIRIVSPAKYYSTSQTFIIDISEIELNFEDKVYYTVSPNSPIEPGLINFTLTTISPGSYIEWFAIYTSLNSTEYLDNSTTASGGNARIELNLTNQTGWLTITYFIKATDEDTFIFTGGYYITDVIPGNNSVVEQADEWEGVFNTMWRVIIAVAISVVSVLVFVQFTGPEAAGVIGLLFQIAFVVIGWIPLLFVIIEAVCIIGLYMLSQRGAV